jgi:hypothetical protein
MEDPDHIPDSLPGTPRWVIVSAIIALLLVLTIVGLHLAGYSLGGHH